LILTFYVITKENKEFKAYLNGTEVDSLELVVGLELDKEYNETLFESCALELQNYSNNLFAQEIMKCMDYKNIYLMYGNITKRDLNLEWVYSNCEKEGENYKCGDYIIKWEEK